MAWDIYRHWDLWVQSCCPAEEARLKRKGLAFDGPEDFAHADEVSTLPSPHAVDSSPKGLSGSPNTRVVSADLETPPRQRQQLEGRSSFSKADGGAGGTNATFVEKGPGGEGGGGEGGDDEEEFMPRAGMSAKTVVRARRQWALRRARRREGPNEANQLELGGGSAVGSGIGEAWVETVVKVATVAGKDGAAGTAEDGEGIKAFVSGGNHAVGSGGPSGGAGGGGGDQAGVVALLVSSVISTFLRLVRKVAISEKHSTPASLLGNLWFALTPPLEESSASTSSTSSAAISVRYMSIPHHPIESPTHPSRTEKARLCRERHDWEVVRAAAAALSVAAYHEDNADRMGRAAPDLIPVLVSLLPHPDPEVQAHAATALANLAHGSPSYQSEAGEAGAIGALLDICRGRASVGGNDEDDGGGGARDVVVAPVVSGTGGGIVLGTAGASENRGSGGGAGTLTRNRSRGRKDPENNPPEVEDPRGKAKQGIRATEEGEERKEGGTGGGTGEKWARRVGSGNEEGPGAVAMGGEKTAVKARTGFVESEGGRTGQDQNEQEAGVYERREGTMVVRNRRREVEDEGGEEGGAAESMDVDAVQAATAALANLLCYSEANSVRLVAAGGIGVLVGLVSSYRPQDLLDSDQVRVVMCVFAGEQGCEV